MKKEYTKINRFILSLPILFLLCGLLCFALPIQLLAQGVPTACPTNYTPNATATPTSICGNTGTFNLTVNSPNSNNTLFHRSCNGIGPGQGPDIGNWSFTTGSGTATCGTQCGTGHGGGQALWSGNPSGTNCSPFGSCSPVGNPGCSAPTGVNPVGKTCTLAGNRVMATQDFNLTCPNVYMSFQIILGLGGSPCENLDLQGEDVYFEYSTNGGASWTVIQCWRSINSTAQGCVQGNQGTWNTYNPVLIPAAALTPNTRFRWVQYENSGSCCDHWAIDNVTIQCPGCTPSYQWSSTNPTAQAALSNPNIQSPTANNLPPGSYTYNVSIPCSPCQTPFTASVTVNVNPPPTFTPPAPVCVGQTAVFQSSTATAASTWNFGAGATPATATGQGPHNVTYSAAGTKNITLTSPGCPAVPGTLVVNPTPGSAFTGNPTLTCTNSPVALNYTGTPVVQNATYNWNCDGCTQGALSGAGPHTISWTTTGTKTVTLQVTGPAPTNCASPVTSVIVTVNPPPLSAFTATGPVCISSNTPPAAFPNANTSTVQLNAPPQPAPITYAWDFGQDATPATATTGGPFTNAIQWSTSGVKTISVSVTSPGCSPATTTQTVLVQPLPTATFTATPTVCAQGGSPNNGINATIDFTGTLNTPQNNGTATGHIFTWNCNGCTQWSAPNSPPSAHPAAAQQHQLSWNTPGTKTLTLTLQSGGCVATQVTQSVVVNPIPTSTFSLSQDSVCGTGSINWSYTGQLGTPPHTFDWNCSGCVGGPPTSTNTNFNISWAQPGFKPITLSVTSSGCTSLETTDTVKVSKIPAVNLVASPQQVCENTNANAFTSLLTYSGDAGTGTGANQPPLFAWHCSGCVVPVNAPPVPNPPNPPGFPAAVPPLAPYDFGGQGPFALSWANAGVKTILLTVQNMPSGCFARDTAFVTVEPTPLLPTINNTSRCGPGLIALGDANAAPNPSTNPDLTIRWYAAAGAIQPLFQGASWTYNLTTTTVLFVSSYNTQTQCESNRVPLTITVNPFPGLPSAQPVERCGPGQVSFSALMGFPPGDVMRLYSVPTGGTPIVTSIAGPPYILTPPEPVTQTTLFYVATVFTATGCEVRTPVQATIHSIPAIPISINEARCQPGAVTFFVGMGNPAGLQVNLYTSSVGQSPIDVDFTSPFTLTTPSISTHTTYWISASNPNTTCESPLLEVVARIYFNPPAPSAPPVARCGAGTVTLTSNLGVPPGISVHLYTQPAGGNPVGVDNTSPFEIMTPPLSTTTSLYLQSVNDSTFCASDRIPVLVTINPLPGLPEVEDVGRCGPGVLTFTALPTGATLADEILLYDAPIGGNIVSSDNSFPYELATPPLASTVTYYVQGKVSATGCQTVRQPVVAFVDQEPGPPSAGNVSRCGPGAVRITATMGSPAGRGIRLYTQMTGGQAIITDDTAPYELTLPNVTQSGTYYVESAGGTCLGSVRVPVVVTINPIPEPPISFNQERCGPGVFTFPVTIGSGGNEVHLYMSQGAGAPAAIDNVFPFELVTPDISLSQQIFIASVNSATGCGSLRVPYDAIVNPIPGLPIVRNSTRCETGPITFTIEMGFPAGTRITLYDGMGPGANSVAIDNDAPYELLVANITTNTTYYAEASDPVTGCIGPRAAVVGTVNPNPEPASPLVNPVGRCGPGVVTFEAVMGFPAGDEIRLYTLPSGGNFLDKDNTPPYQVTTPVISQSATFYLESVVTGTGCISPRTPVRAIIHDPPSEPSASSINRCGAGSGRFSVSMGAILGTEVRMYESLLAPTPLTKDDSSPYELETPLLTTTQDFFISAYDANTGCESNRVRVRLEILPVPGEPIINGASRCGPGPVTIFAFPGFPEANILQVYEQAVGGSPLVTDFTSPYELSLPYLTTSTTFFVNAKNSLTGCEGPRKSVIATINDKPAPPQTEDVSRCAPGPIQFTGLMASPIGNMMRLYTQPLGGTPIAEDMSSPFYLNVQHLSTTTMFYMESINTITGCVSDRTPVAGVMHPLPSPASVPLVARCGEGSVTFTVTMGITLGDFAILYTHPTDGEVITSDNIPPYHLTTPPIGDTKTFFVGIKNAVSGCESIRVPAVAQINPVPRQPLVALPTVCGPGSATFLVTAQGPTGNSVRLFSVPTGGSVLDENFGPQYQLQTPSLAVTTTFYVEHYDYSTDCGSHRTPVTVTVHPRPDFPKSNELTRCGPGNFTFTAQMGNVPGTEIRLYLDANDNVPYAKDAVSVYELITPTVSTTTTFWLSSYDFNTGCESFRLPIMGSIQDIPAIPSAEPALLCGGGSAIFNVLMGSPAGSEIRLYDSPNESVPLLVDNTAPYEIATPFITSSTLYYLSSFNAVSGCESEKLPIRAVVNRIPEPPIVQNEKQCGSGRTVFFVETSSVQGGWARLYDAPTQGNLIAEDVQMPYELLTSENPALAQTQIYTYYVSAIVDGCESQRRPVTVTVHPLPGVPVVNDAFRCGAGVVQFSVNGFVAPEGDGIRLYNGPVHLLPIDEDFSAPFVVSTPSIEANATFYITSVNSQTGCESPRYSVTAIVAPTPGLPTVSDVTRCGPGPVTISAIMGAPEGNEIRFYNAPSGGTLIASAVNQPWEVVLPNITTDTQVYAASADRFTNCESNRVAVGIKIAAFPSPPTAEDVTRCGPGNVVISVFMGAQPGNEVRLYTTATDGSALFIDNNAPYRIEVPQVQTTATFYLEAYATSSECGSVRTPVSVRINNVPQIPAASDIERCGAGPVTITANMGSPAGDEIRLYELPTGTLPIAIDNNPPYLLNSQIIQQTTTLYIASYVNSTGCESERLPIKIFVHPVPGIPDAIEATRCGAGKVIFSPTMGAPAGSALRLFTSPLGGSPVAMDNLAPYVLETPQITTTTTFYLENYDESTGCASNRAPAVGIIAETPGLPTSQDVRRCGPGAVTFSILMGQPVGTSLRAYGSPAGGNPLAEDHTPPYELTTPSLTTTAKWYIAAYNHVLRCEGPRLEVNAIILPIPAPPFAPPISICGAGPVTLSATMGTPAGNQVRVFSLPTSSEILASAGSPFVLNIPHVQNTTTLYLESFDDQTGCVSERSRVAVTVHPGLGVPQPLPLTRCGAGKVTITVIPGSPIGKGVALYTTSGGGGAIASATNPPYELTAGVINTHTTFYVESVDFITGCKSPRVEAPVIVNPLPGAPATNDVFRCGPGSVTISAVMTAPSGSELRLYESPQAANFVQTTSTSPYIFVTPPISATVTYYISSFNIATGCESARAPVVANVTPKPAPPIVAFASRCGPGTVLITAQMGIPAGNQIRLFSVATSGAPLAQDDTAPYELLTPSINNTTTFFVESYNLASECASERTPVRVEVTPRPGAPMVMDVARCGNGSIVFTAIMGSPAANQIRLFTQLNATDPIDLAIGAPYEVRTPIIGTTTTYYIEAYNTHSNCGSPRREVQAIVHPLPGVPNVSDVSRCGEGSIAITASMGNPSGTELRLYEAAQGGTILASSSTAPYVLSSPALSSSTILYVASFDAASGCEGARKPVQITVSPSPEPPIRLEAQRCGSGEITFTITEGIPAGQQMRLYTLASGGSVIGSASGSVVTITTPAVTTTTTFYLERFFAESNCASLRTQAIARVLSQPGKPSAMAVERCGAGPVAITANMGGPAGEFLRLYTQVAGGQPIGFLQNPPYVFTPSLSTTTILYLESANSVCASERLPVTVTIHPIPPDPVASNDGPKCFGESVNLSVSAISGATYSWQGPNGFSASGASVSRVLNSTLDVGTYSVLATLGPCTSQYGQTTVTARPFVPEPIPVAYNVFGQPQISFCEGDELNLAISNFPDFPLDTKFEWVGPSFYNPPTTHSQPVLPNLQLINEGMYYVRAIANGCTSAMKGTLIEVRKKPEVAIATNNGPLCIGATIQLFASEVQQAGQYIWVGPNGFNATGRNVSRSAQFEHAGVYSVTVVSIYGCTASAPATTRVLVNPLPAQPRAINNGPVCSGQSVEFTITSPENGLFLWRGPNGFNLSANNKQTQRFNVSPADSGVYSVAIVQNGCTSSFATTRLVVRSTPEAVGLLASPNYCVGDTARLRVANPVEGYRYVWQGPAGFTATGSEVIINNVTTRQEGIYQLYVENEGCRSQTVQTSLIVSPIPQAPALASNAPICAGGILFLTALAEEGESVVWHGPNGFIAVGPDVRIENVGAANAGVYYAYATNTSCSSMVSQIEVRVNPIPPAPNVFSSGPVCEGGNISLSVPAVNGMEYYWRGPSGFSAATSEVLIPRMQTSNIGAYSVVAIANGCTSLPGIIQVTLLPNPPAPAAGSNAPICVGETLVLTANSAAGALFRWVGPGGFSAQTTGATVMRPALSTTAAGAYSVVAIIGGCTSEARIVNVVLRNTPNPPAASNNGPRCVGQLVSLQASGLPGATYTWSGPNGFVAMGASANRLLTSLQDGGIYQVRAIVEGCTSAPANTRVEVFEVPDMPVITHNGPVCRGDNLVLTAAASSSGANVFYSWSGPNSFSATGISVSRTTSSILDAGTYSVVAINGRCSSSVATAYIDVVDLPTLFDITSNAPLCAGQTLNLTAPVLSNAVYEWRGPNGFFSAQPQPSRVNITVEDAGNYELLLRVGACTSRRLSTQVVVNPRPTTPTASSNGPVCAGNTLQLFATTIAGASYSWTGPNGFISNEQNPSVIDAQTSAAGQYAVVAVMGSCSSAFSNVMVNVLPSPSTPAVISGQSVCVGSTLQLSASTVPGANYIWSGPNNYNSAVQNPIRGNITMADAGLYSVRAIANGCTSGTASTEVKVNPVPRILGVGNNGPLCQGQVLTLTASSTPGATYIWIGPGAFQSALQNPFKANVTLADAGVYTLQAAIGNCTSAAATTTVVVRPAPSNVVVSNNGPVCSGQSLQISASVIEGANYQWVGPNGFTVLQPNVDFASASVAHSGAYSLTVSLGPCSAQYVTQVVVNPTPPTPIVANNGPLCLGQALELRANAIPGVEYFWSGPAGFTSSLQNPVLSSSALAGEYQLYVVAANCTSGVARTQVEVAPSITDINISATGEGRICAGDSLVLSATPLSGVHYRWSGPAGFAAEGAKVTLSKMNGSQTGTYTLTPSYGNCSLPQKTISVTVLSRPTLTNVTNTGPVCVGQPIALSATGVAGANYYWVGPGGFSSTLLSPSIETTSAANEGVYTLVAFIGGCTSQPATTTVRFLPTPSAPVITGERLLCEGQTLSLGANLVPGVSYLWQGPNDFSSTSPQLNIQNVTAFEGGTYRLIAIQNGCTSSASFVEVGVTPIPILESAGYNGPICAGQPLNLTASLIPGAAYRWSGPGGYTSNEQNPTIRSASQNQAGAYFVYAIVNGCTSETQSVEVIVNRSPGNLTASNSGAACAGARVQLSANLIAGATYRWVGPNGFSSAAQNPVINNASTLASGVYTVVATVGSCRLEATTSVVIQPAPTNLQASYNGPLCEGQTMQLNASFIAGASYSWSGPNGFVSVEQNVSIPNVSFNHAGNYSVTAVIGNCSSSAAVVQVSVLQAPRAIMAGSSSPVCEGQTLQLNATSVPGATYLWSGPNNFTSTQQSPVIAGVTSANAGVYQVQAIIGSCASPVASTNVIISPRPMGVTASSNSPVCVGGTLELTASLVSGATYAWVGPAGFASNERMPSISNVSTAQAGTYSVVAMQGACSSTIASVTVQVFANDLPITAGANTPLCEGGTLQLSAPPISGASYRWSGPQGFTAQAQSPTLENVSVAASGVYSLVVVTGSCTSRPATVNVSVSRRPLQPELLNNSPICAGQTLRLTAIGGSGVNFEWSGPNGFTATGASITLPNASSASSGLYTVWAVNGGCTSLPVTTVAQVNAPSAAWASGNETICSGSETHLGLIFSGNGPWTLRYLENNTEREITVSDSSYAPIVRPQAASVYRLVSVKDRNGCEARLNASKIIAVESLPIASAVSSFQACPGQVVNVPVTISNVNQNTGWVLNYIYNGRPLSFAGQGNGIFTLPLPPISGTLQLQSIGNTNAACVNNLTGAATTTVVTVESPASITGITPAQGGATVSWSGVATASGYNLRYRPVGETAWGQINDIASTTYFISGLSAGVLYEFEVQTVCEGAGASAWSSPQTLTLAASCLPPQGVVINQVTGTTAQVSWNGGAADVCHILAYGLSSQDPATWTEVLVPVPTQTFLLTGLQPGLSYSVRLRSNCNRCSRSGVGLSDWGAVASFHTLAAKQNASAQAPELHLYPNPNKGAFTLAIEAREQEALQLKVSDLAGRAVFERSFVTETGWNRYAISLPEVAPGVYFVEVKSSEISLGRIKIVVE